jgi:hypothetical protein
MKGYPMNKIEELFLKAWRQKDYRADEELPEYIELPKNDFSRILVEANNELERICLESKEIIEGFHKLLGVHSSTEALGKIAALMHEADLGWTCKKCGTSANVGYRCSWCEEKRP